MSDLEDPADVPVETAQDAVEPTTPIADDVPWAADEYDRERAYNTLQHVRKEAKEFEQAAKQFERLRNDPDAFREFVAEQGFEIPEDEEPDEPSEPTYHDPRVDQLLAEREQERLNNVVMEQAASDVKEIQTEIGRELSPKELEKLGRLAIPDENGIPRVSLAWNELKELQGDWQKQWIAGKKTGAPPSAGTQGSEKFDIRDPDQRIKRFVASMEAHSGE